MSWIKHLISAAAALLLLASCSGVEDQPSDQIVIGLTKSTTPRLAYLHLAVKDAGAVIYEIPEYLTTSEKAKAALKDLDAVIIPGAGTADPSERKTADVATIQAAREMGMPILGICHGHQYINKALGGKIGEIDDYYTNALEHYGHAYEYYHTVSVEPGSFLYEINGGETEMETNSNHSYCIRPDAIAPGLKVISYSTADNVIEAIESEDGKVIGVQWHPEVMYGKFSDQTSLEIFKYLVRLAEDYHSQKD